MYDGSTVVNRSIELGEPVIYVNFNYRLNAFGWLGGKEALAAGAANNGLYDRERHLNQQTSATLTMAFVGYYNPTTGDSGIRQKCSS